MSPRVKVYFDGGCRPMPIGMETAVVVRGRCYFQHDLGPGSSMDAEWLALIRALQVTRTLGLEHPLFLGDALAVIGQANGSVKCRGSSLRHLLTVKALNTWPDPLPIRHVKRTQNLAGIALARLHDR